MLDLEYHIFELGLVEFIANFLIYYLLIAYLGNRLVVLRVLQCNRALDRRGPRHFRGL